jgi:hypothetical protein
MKQVVFSIIIAALSTAIFTNAKATPMTATDISFASGSVGSFSTGAITSPISATLIGTITLPISGTFTVGSIGITPPSGVAITGISSPPPVFASAPPITVNVVTAPINVIHQNVLKNTAPPTPIIMSIPSIKPLVQIIDTGAKTMARGIDLNTISLSR